jgi:putative tricarboxylic transport membrane protein
MNKKGEGLKALHGSLIASTVGGVFGGIALILLSQPLVAFALRFGPPEYFSLGIAGLTLIAGLSGKEIWRGCAAALIGMLLVSVGVDPISGTTRFTFGFFELYEGIPFLIVLIGVFAVSEAFSIAENTSKISKSENITSEKKLSRGEVRKLIPTFLRGSIIGTVVGAIPGAGANIAGWFAYDQERRWSKNPKDFGSGELKGVAAPEAANSASVGGALMPLLTLGLPGSPTTAVLLGAFVLHGLQPGPQLFEERPDVIYGMFIGLMVAYVLVLILGIAAMPLWYRVLRIPKSVLVPAILLLSMIGAYSVRNLLFDVWLTLGFGVLGYVLKKFRFPMAPLVLAMVLGKIVESNYARSLILSHGDHIIFLERPLSLSLLVVAALSLLLPFIKTFSGRRK